MTTRPRNLIVFALAALVVAFVIPIAGQYWPGVGAEALAAEASPWKAYFKPWGILCENACTPGWCCFWVGG